MCKSCRTIRQSTNVGQAFREMYALVLGLKGSSHGLAIGLSCTRVMNKKAKKKVCQKKNWGGGSKLPALWFTQAWTNSISQSRAIYPPSQLEISATIDNIYSLIISYHVVCFQCSLNNLCNRPDLFLFVFPCNKLYAHRATIVNFRVIFKGSCCQPYYPSFKDTIEPTPSPNICTREGKNEDLHASQFNWSISLLGI